jgi:chemotaxis protein methyltransferase CheR
MAEPGMQPALWEEAGRRIESAIGLNFGARPASELRRAVRSAAEQLGFRDSGAFVAHLLARPLDAQERAALAKCLAIGETYFFRDPLLFDCLGTQVLPPLIQARRGGERRLRLWSAACSTGEEPYSLAMLVASVLPDWPQWDIRILASDLNAAALDKARAGVYGRWSLRGGMPAAARPFLRKPAADRYEVAPEIRGLVRFASMNLVEDAFPSAADGMAAMDVILCRNVLIYFEPRRGQAVLERLGRCLGPQGWLFTSPIEVPTAPVAGLERARLGSVPALRRSTGGDAAAAPKALLPLPVPTASPAAPPRRPARHAASGRQRAAPRV